MVEVEYLYHHKNVRAILFFDDNLLIDSKRCIELSKALCERNLDLIWVAEGSVKVEMETLKWMKKAGCQRIDFGVESGSQKILNNIGKSFTVEDTRRAFKLCRQAGIKPNAYLMLGSPGETPETLRETVELMSEIQPHESVSIDRAGLWILPETEIYGMSLSQGIIREDDWLDSDETFMYTGEHSRQDLQSLADEYRRLAMRKDRAWLGIPRMLWLWGNRLRRLRTEPRALLTSARHRLFNKDIQR